MIDTKIYFDDNVINYFCIDNDAILHRIKCINHNCVIDVTMTSVNMTTQVNQTYKCANVFTNNHFCNLTSRFEYDTNLYLNFIQQITSPNPIKVKTYSQLLKQHVNICQFIAFNISIRFIFLNKQEHLNTWNKHNR